MFEADGFCWMWIPCIVDKPVGEGAACFCPRPFPKDSNIFDNSYTVTAVEKDANRESSRRRVKKEKVAYTKVAGMEGQGAHQA